MNINELIAQYGPALVAAAQRQVAVAVSQDIAWAVGMALAMRFGAWRLYRFGRRLLTEHRDYDEKDLVGGLCVGAAVAAAIILGILVLTNLGEVWTFIANPEYATITIIRRMVLAK